MTTQYIKLQTHKGLHRVGGQIKLSHSLSEHQIIEIPTDTFIQFPLLLDSKFKIECLSLAQ